MKDNDLGWSDSFCGSVLEKAGMARLARIVKRRKVAAGVIARYCFSARRAFRLA